MLEVTYLKPGKYRRAFDWRISATTKESISSIAGAFVGLQSEEWIDIFEDYLRISRKRIKNRTAMAKLQFHLVDDLMVAQAAIKQYRKKWDDLKAEIEKRGGVDSGISGDLETVERELFLHRAHANCIRTIGDGIAWRALNYDRAALRALSGNAVKQQILELGFVNELRELSRAFDTGQGMAILNALTNWLAIGDITLIKNDGSVDLVEVKSSETESSRIARQKKKMQEVSDLLKAGRGTLDDQNITIVRLNITPENDLRELFGLLQEAGCSGWVGRRVSGWSYLEAIDFRVLGDFERAKNEAIERESRETASWGNNDFVVALDSLDLLAFTPNCAPFTVFPFPERLCIELATGAKSYRCSLNLTEIGREFERHGWEVEQWPQDLLKEGAGPDSPYFRLRKDGLHHELPPADVMRMQMETLRPHAILQALEAVLKLGPGGVPSAIFIVYEGEKDLWF